MKRTYRSLLLGLAPACLALSLAAAPATHDLEVKLRQLNANGGMITYPGPVKFEMKVTNKGPGKVTGAYKMIVNKFDHTGQRWIKSVFTRDLPLLDAPGGNLTYFTYQIEDTAGDPRTDSGMTFIYRASIGPGYYTDPVNANNRSDVGIRFLKPASAALNWTNRVIDDETLATAVTEPAR